MSLLLCRLSGVFRRHVKDFLPSLCYSVDDWQALNDLKEFIPNVESKSVDEINKMIKYDLDRFKEFRRQGKPILESLMVQYLSVYHAVM